MSSTSIQFIGTATEAQRLVNETTTFQAIAKATAAGLRVSMPGVVQSFDAIAQTVTVQLSVFEKIKINGVISDKQIPVLLDCPIVLPRSGGYALTLPIRAGDECLVVFADLCINSWFTNGGTNNVQQWPRRHDFSDGFAIIGAWSQPRKLMAYQTGAAQLRSDAGDVKVSVGTQIELVAPTISADNGGTTQQVMLADFYNWFVDNIVPYLATHMYSGPPPPLTSVSTVLKAE